MMAATARPAASASPVSPIACVVAACAAAPAARKTSANVPRASASRGRASPCGGLNTAAARRSPLHPFVDVVAEPPNRIDVLAGRVRKLRVLGRPEEACDLL